MNSITKETRKESFEKIQLKKKNKLIYEQLGNGEYTARELAIKMYNTTDKDGKRLLRTAERQETAPRLTELEKLDLVETVDKKYDELSGCKVAVYKRKEVMINVQKNKKKIRRIDMEVYSRKYRGIIKNYK